MPPDWFLPGVKPGDPRLGPPRPGVRHVHVRRWCWWGDQKGVIVADDPLRLRVRRFFHWPMIVLALAVLPLLAVEFLVNPPRLCALWWVCIIAMTIIWLAFVIEFIIKITIAEHRFEYVRHNWLDIIIILMPALRPLRLASIAKTTKVFTLRGVGMKAVRYTFTVVVGLEATERMLERVGLSPRKTIDPDRMTRRQLIAELKQLRAVRDRWERWYEAHEAHVAEHGRAAAFDEPPPCAEPDVADEAQPEPDDPTFLRMSERHSLR